MAVSMSHPTSGPLPKPSSTRHATGSTTNGSADRNAGNNRNRRNCRMVRKNSGREWRHSCTEPTV